jgi:hypothetical protein
MVRGLGGRLSVIDKLRAMIQSNVTARRAFELGTFSGNIRLRGEDKISQFFDLNDRMHEREMAIPAK